METSIAQTELIAPSPVAIRGDIEKIKSLSVRRLDTDSEFEPVGVVTARIVGKLMASLQKDAA